MVEYDRDDPLLTICAHVTALERASKNNLVDLFCQLREDSGWVVDRVTETSKESPYNEARRERRSERAEMLLNARRLTESDFIDLDALIEAGSSVLDEDRAAHEKYRFERDIGIAVDADLVSMNLDGRLPERVESLAEITSIWSRTYLDDPFGTLAAPTDQPKGRLQAVEPALLIGVLMRIAGLTTKTGLQIDRELSVDMLTGFIRICRENQTMLEEALSEPIRSDFERNPVRQLNRYLARIGLVLDAVRVEKRNGKKIRLYRLPEGRTNRMLALAASRAEVKRCKAEVDETRKRRPLGVRDGSPQQGTKENSAYMKTNTDLLSLIDPANGSSSD
jgi:hypothetical protein